jgi:tetratricopeptide (TPR) repeat protein
MVSRERARTRLRHSSWVCALSLVTSAWASGASADFVPPPAAPETVQIPSKAELDRDPLGAADLLMELSEKAERAEANHQPEAAIPYYLGIARLVPDRALAFSRLCDIYQQIEQHDLAVQACSRAIGLPGVTLADYLRYATLLLAPVPDRALSPDEVSELDAVFAHLAAQGGQSADAGWLMCRLGVKLESVERLRQCLAVLERALPDASAALPYRFSLAMLERDFTRGRDLIQRAEESGLGPEVTGLMRRELETRDTRSPLLLTALALVVIGVVGLALGRFLRRRSAARALAS